MQAITDEHFGCCCDISVQCFGLLYIVLALLKQNRLDSDITAQSNFLYRKMCVVRFVLNCSVE